MNNAILKTSSHSLLLTKIQTQTRIQDELHT